MKNSIIYLFLLLLSTHLTAQNLNPDLNQAVAVPQSPEAAAFEKYGNVPVSMYTGTPSVSVPIFNLRGREMSVPASLSYDASGIKVDQMATWVGLGWNLNVGGVVTRQVAGLPDGYPITAPGFIGQRVYDTLITEFIDYIKSSNMAPGTTHPNAYWEYLDKFDVDQKNLAVDLEPDIFSFNANGLSGNIFINYAEDTAYCQSDPNIRVEFEFDSSLPVKDQLSSWTITGPDGTKYIFAHQENTKHEFEHMFDDFLFDVEHEYTSAWYLSHIISPSKKDKIDFLYTAPGPWSHSQPQSYGISSKSDPINASTLSQICGTGTKETASMENKYNIQQFSLQSIVINNRVAASFHLGSAMRKDLKGRYPLSYIEVNNQTSDGAVLTSSIANTIKFKHSYFGNLADTLAVGEESENKVRLMLESVHMLGAPNSNTQPQVYSFEYESPTLLPYRNDLGVDFWGYYNGANNTDLIPSYDDGNVVLPGAYREASLAETKIGTLTKIQYPTGGHSEFSYSLHSLPPNQNQYLEEEREYLFSLQGGIDPSDPYNYLGNDDVLHPLGSGPEGQDGVFRINSDEFPAKVRFEITGSPVDNNFRQYLVLYKSYDGDCTPDITTSPPTLCPSGQELDFGELFNQNTPPNPLEILYFDNPFSGASTYLEIPIYSSGEYRVMALNTDSQVSVDVEVSRTIRKTATSPVVAGGLRVFKTVDRKEPSGNDEVIKYYYYENLNNLPNNISPENVALSFFNTTYSSSAVVHAPLRFHTTSTNNSCQGGTGGIGPYSCTTLIRHRSNLLRSPGPNISYTTVSEVQYSSAEGYNGFSVFEYYNEKETLTDISYAKRKLNNGENRRSRIYDKYGTLLEETYNYLSVKSIPGIASTRGIIKSSSGSITGVRYTQGTDTDGNYSYQDYAIWCKDPNAINLPPSPCTNTILVADTIWLNGFGLKVAATIDFRWLPFIQFYNMKEPFGGSSQLCNGPCIEGEDFKIDLFTRTIDGGFPAECEEGTFPYFNITHYAHSSFWMRLDSTVTTRYENDNSITSSSYNYYDRESEGALGHYQLTRTESTNSDGTSYESRIYYPDDVDIDIVTHPDYASISLFNSAEKDVIRLLNCANLHRIGTPILQESFVNGNRTFLQKNTFTDLGLSTWSGIDNDNIVMPHLVKNSQGNGTPLKKVIEYHAYDDIGNPLEISRGQNGAHIAFRWGYNNTYVIDRIDNATKAEVDAAGQGNDLRQDGTLGPQSMVNSYEYESKFGRVSKITDPNGRATTFTYDGFGRLVQVLDHNGNLRSLTEYNLGN